MADAVERAVDIDRLLTLAREIPLPHAARGAALNPPGQRIALACDAAFTFVYPHILAHWRSAGAEIRPFSPLADEAPPRECDVCWLPGGYPELHAGRIAAAGNFLAGLCAFAQARPVHGECGGYMVLGRTLEDAQGNVHSMAGLLPVDTSYAKRRMHLGYRVARLIHDGPLGRAGASLMGHEFHYASVTASETDRDLAFADVTDAEHAPFGTAGHRCGQVSGSFFHLIARR